VQCNSKEKVPTLICYWLMTRNSFGLSQNRKR
jgi:hypothetical protein